MNLHKDKERLRHQRQVKLLHDVMKIIPRPFNGSASKVRKLRHLVLYYHFMQKVHAQITKGHSDIINGGKKSAKQKAERSACKPLMMHYEPKNNPKRANIVFLQVDQSKNREENSLDSESFVKDRDIYPASVTLKKLEYKTPDVVVSDTNDSNAAFDHNSHVPVGNNIQTVFHDSSSPSEYSLQSDLAFRNNEEKENYFPSITNYLVMNSADRSREESSVYDQAKIPENIINDENVILNKRRKIDFQNILEDYSNNSTLKDSTVPNVINEGFYVANINFPEQNTNYIVEACPFQNISGYPINLSSGNVILTNNNLNHKPLCNLDSTMLESQLYSLPSPENVSDNCSSSTLTDNLHIDIENFSDSSNEACPSKASSSDDLNVNNNVFIAPTALVYDFSHGILSNYDDHLPFISSSHNYLENYNEQNEISLRPVGYLPHFDGIFPNIINLNDKPSTSQYVEPIHSFQDRLNEPRFVSDNVSFYSPSVFENLSYEKLSLPNTKLETKSELFSEESLSTESKPALDDEETSFSLTQYINNY